jgi:predicted ester cyclase
MDGAERERQVRTFVDEVWNAKNYDAAADLYGEDYVNPFGTGPAARVEPIRRYHQAFPDLRLDVEEVIVAGDTVVLRATFRGTDTGGYVGRPPTGGTVDEWVVTIMHFDGDQVVREWIGADKLGLFIQLGVVDDPWPQSTT